MLRLLALLLAACTLVVFPQSTSAAPVGPRRHLLKHPFSNLLASFRGSLPLSTRQADGDADANAVETIPLPSDYIANVTVQMYPNTTPPQTRPMVFSIFVSESNFTDPIFKATVDCLSNSTSVEAEQWGIWEYRSLLNTSYAVMQAGMYVNVPDSKSDGSFTRKLKDYIGNGTDGLAECVRSAEVGFGADGKFYMAREPEDRTDIAFSSVAAENGGIPPWVPALVIGLAGVVCMVGFLIAKATARGKRYDPTDYANDMPLELDEVPTEETILNAELAVMADGTY